MTTIDEIRRLVEASKVVIFMKGTPDAPACGFSAATVDALKQAGRPFEHQDVLKKPGFREALSCYSGWPTVPQVFIGGEFIGGCALVQELQQSGEFSKKIEAACE